MSNESISVFISYCKADLEGLEWLLEFWKEKLEQISERICHVILDRTEEDLIGASLHEFENRISAVDVAISFIGPHYDARVSSSASHHCVSEFQRIQERRARKDERFLFIPMYLTVGTSLMETCGVSGIDLSFLASRASKEELRKRVVRRVERTWRSITAHKVGSSAITPREKRVLDFLFRETSADFLKTEHRIFIDRIVVETYFMQKLTQRTDFIVGRKGSGKSTVSQVMPLRFRPIPKTTIRFEFDNLQWSRIVSHLICLEKHELLVHSQDLALVWEVFFVFCIIWRKRDRFNVIEKSRSPLLKNLTALTDERTAQRLAFTDILACASELYSAKKEVGPVSRRLHPLSDGSLINETIGKDLFESFLRESRPLRTAEILFVGDGFNLRVDILEEHRAKRTLAEGSLVTALAEYVVSTHRENKSVISSESSNFIVSVPNDRMLLVKSKLRDVIKANVCHLYWTGVELSAVVRKRIAAFKLLREHGVDDSKAVRVLFENTNWRNVDPKPQNDARDGEVVLQRLGAITKNFFPELPELIEFELHGRPYSISLFCYVLRHSLWRPRDVLHYYFPLFELALSARRRRQSVSIQTVRDTIAGKTKKLVEEEVVKEYREFFHRFPSVLAKFAGKAQVMKGSTFLELVSESSTIREREAEEDRTTRSFSILCDLFDMGLIGLRPQDVGNRVRLGREWSFSFQPNEGRFVPSRSTFEHDEIALHPMLKEYLNLDTKEHPMVLNYTDPWLAAQDKWIEENLSSLNESTT